VKKLLLVIIIFPLAGLSCAPKTLPPAVITGAEADVLPGETWLNMADEKKVVFVEGIVAGINSVVRENMVFLLEGRGTKETNDEVAEKLQKLLTLYARQKLDRAPTADEVRLLLVYEKEFRSKKLVEYGVYDVSVEKLARGVDDLYEEPKNRNVAVVDALYLAKIRLKGAPPGDLERIINYLRGGKRDRSVLNIKDEKGKTVKIIRFP
jgi:hypothetical protein